LGIPAETDSLRTSHHDLVAPRRRHDCSALCITSFCC